MDYQKVKSSPKTMNVKGNKLSSIVLDTMKTIADIVGCTLGPGGHPVLIERFEHDLTPIITKDGVTVFNSLGFNDPTQHCILESARDTARRTATEAGDGSSTSTILAEAIVRLTNQYCLNNPRVSPQKVVRKLEYYFRDVIDPAINDLTIKLNSTTDEGRLKLLSVATVSANGDKALAEAVLQCFDIVGDDGNVTITESTTGLKSYEVEEYDGYAVGMGYDESCGRFFGKFINEQSTQRCFLEKPVFIVYHGAINEVATLLNGLANITDSKSNNIVLVTTGLSESVVGWLATMFDDPRTFNIFPLTISRPVSAMFNSQLHLLNDICAITGATLMDPMTRKLGMLTVEDMGPGVEHFEASRFRSTIVGTAEGEYEDVTPEGNVVTKTYEDRLLSHVADVKALADAPEGIYEAGILKERVGKLTGGIAKLKVCGTSGGDIREKKDRADDAVCAVRGAIKHGCLPGGGWTLLKLIELMKKENNEIIDQILIPAIATPVHCLLSNCGLNEDEITETVSYIVAGMSDDGYLVYDAYDQKFVDAIEGGILDSTSAVREAIRSSISIASNLGTLGATVVYGRDEILERSEAVANLDFSKTLARGDNPANERP